MLNCFHFKETKKSSTIELKPKNPLVMGDVKGRESVNKENELQFITQVKQKAPLNMYPPFST